MSLFDQWGYTNFHELNLSWLLRKMVELTKIVENFVALNAIKYADPIQWSITRQYEKNTVVVDPLTGTAYLSSKPVPAGVGITNTDYWSVIFTLDVISANKNITLRDDGSNVLATFASNAGDWLLWNGTLYRVSQAINTNEAYVVGYNLDRYTVEMFISDYVTELKTEIGDLTDLDTTDKDNLVDAINEVLATITNISGDLTDLNTTDKDNLVDAINEVLQTLSNTAGNLTGLNTTDKSNLVAAINEVLVDIADVQKYADIQWVTPQMYGALANGVHDDTTAIQTAINTGKLVYFPRGIYRTTGTLTLTQGTHLMGSMGSQAHGNTYGATILHDGAGNTISIPASTPCIIENLLINKINNTGGTGIDIYNSDHFQIKYVKVINHNIGISVNGCSFGELDHCVCERNYLDGFYLTSNTTLGACQVQITGCLAELNDGCGFHFVTRVASMPVGIFSKNMTFANTRAGLLYEQLAASDYFNGIKIDGCFFGSDGVLGCVYIKGSQYPVLIDNCYIEEAGASLTGRNYDTPASYTGNGISIGAASGGANINNCAICTSSLIGLSTASWSVINNCTFLNNGISPNTGIKAGVLYAGGYHVINNCLFKSGPVGIYNSQTAPIKVIGNIFNTTTAIDQDSTNIKKLCNIGVADN